MNDPLARHVTAAVHAGLAHANPLSDAQVATLVREVAAGAPRHVLEIGCGPGGFAIELARTCDTEVHAIDINADFLARATARAAGTTLLGRVEFRQEFLGVERDTYWAPSGAAAAFEQAGLLIRHQEMAAASSWQAYEDAVHQGRLRVADTLAEPDAARLRARAEAWRAAVDRDGRRCLGFVAYVASRPAA